MDEYRDNAIHFLKRLERVAKVIRTALEENKGLHKKDFETFYEATGEVTISLVAYIALHGREAHRAAIMEDSPR